MVFHVTQHSFRGVQLDLCYSQTTTLCGINQIIGGGGGTGRAYLG